MLLDGTRHFLAFAVMQGIVLTHDALQLGEFAYHVGEQISLGEMRSALGSSALALRWRAISPASLVTR